MWPGVSPRRLLRLASPYQTVLCWFFLGATGSIFVILMAPLFGAGGPMQLCLQCSCGQGVHRSSGLQKAQAIRMTPRWITSKA